VIAQEAEIARLQQELQHSQQQRETAITESAELRGRLAESTKVKGELLNKLAPLEKKVLKTSNNSG
jgi:hypothetical protein